MLNTDWIQNEDKSIICHYVLALPWTHPQWISNVYFTMVNTDSFYSLACQCILMLGERRVGHSHSTIRCNGCRMYLRFYIKCNDIWMHISIQIINACHQISKSREIQVWSNTIHRCVTSPRSILPSQDPSWSLDEWNSHYLIIKTSLSSAYL